MAIDIPRPLVEDIVDGKCLPFIGAGFSLNADCDSGYSMPDWKGLTEELSRAAGIEGMKDGPDVATIYERKFGRVHLIDTVRRSLHPEHVRPGRAHRALAQLPFDTIYTTNFDVLLEDVLYESRRPHRSLVGELQLPFYAGRVATNIIKMHGDIRHEEHFVITRRDYDTFLEAYPVVATHLSAMLIVRTAFFLGYSRTDSDYLQIESVIKSRLGKFQRMPYIVQFDATPTEIEKGFDNDLHILSISTKGSTSTKSDLIADFLEKLQKEVDALAGKELRRSEEDAFESVPSSTLNLTYQAGDASDLLESSSSLCFVMMPFGRESESIYWSLIKPAAENMGLTPLRADQINSPGVIMEHIRAAIRESRVCIADVSEGNANVLYEIGLAEALGKPVVLIAGHGTQPPFDLAARRYISYDQMRPDAAIDLVMTALTQHLEGGKLKEARALIDGGLYRAAVAIMGVTLEHAIREVLYRADIPTGRRTVQIGQMATALTRAHKIDNAGARLIRQFLEIRNRAVHELQEPTLDEANLAFDLLKNILSLLGKPDWDDGSAGVLVPAG